VFFFPFADCIVERQTNTDTDDNRNKSNLTRRVHPTERISPHICVGIDASRKPDRIALALSALARIVSSFPVVKQSGLRVEDAGHFLADKLVANFQISTFTNSANGTVKMQLIKKTKSRNPS
jgi:hypothetical protein